MKELFLFMVLAIYFNAVRYYELKDLTYVCSLKDYFVYSGYRSIYINAALLFILGGYFLLKF